MHIEIGSTSPSLRSRALDGNEAASYVAYRLSEVIGIYPITPASAMGEHADEWAAKRSPNVWGAVPTIVEMQSEGGAIAAVHGALQTGALATTFTASQGLLLMIPSLYKLAGELTPFVAHIAARSIATHALSIFCDHSDVMACRQCGFALLAASSVQRAHDFACIAHSATLASRVPFLHFFDGFRTSHELARVELISDEVLTAMVPDDRVSEHRARALNPDRPVIRGTAQNPDTFFQGREAVNEAYRLCPRVVDAAMQRFATLTGRRYRLFEYHGHPQAERVIVMMGSGVHAAIEAAQSGIERGERVGVLEVCLYRPFSVSDFMQALPDTSKHIAVLDRTKEPGALGEPLYLDVVAALAQALPSASRPNVIGGRYGLGSKEFTPEMAERVFSELAADAPKQSFTIGIVDDVTGLSLDYRDHTSRKPGGAYEAVFFGLGSDGTVGASKNTIKIMAERTDVCVQGYFVYDSKKSGAVTVSHLRFSASAFQAPYLVRAADFVGCHQFELLSRPEVIDRARDGGVLLLNSPYSDQELWRHMPAEVHRAILDKHLEVYAIDAYELAGAAGLGRHLNIIMQVCFFAISKLLPEDVALEEIGRSITETYARKGSDSVQRNLAVLKSTLAHLRKIKAPELGDASLPSMARKYESAPKFVQRVTSVLLEGKGDLLPVSAFPPDGTWPTGTSQWEKRNLAQRIPVWDPELCIQCNKCVLSCPHAAIRAKVYSDKDSGDAPDTFKSITWRSKEPAASLYTLQVAPEDCTGCRLCVDICPAHDKQNPQHRALAMADQRPLRDSERRNYEFFLRIPETDRRHVHLDVKGSQLLRPLFEYSGACAGCGEAPYIKLLTQLFGDRLLIANATGCSSIFGANLPTTPYTVDEHGHGPAWANSLFEDNAEFGLGFRISVDTLNAQALQLLQSLATEVGESLVHDILTAQQGSEAGLFEQRERISILLQRLHQLSGPNARRLEALAQYLLRRSVWLVGGDGWAYDIGFGGLDHVLAQAYDINVLVLDTEVYSNTGGQQSKSTPMGAVARFASGGKLTPKKDLALMAMTYGHVYVAQVALGAKDAQTVRAFLEAESYRGPSLIIAYSHCVAQGYDLEHGFEHQKLAVDSRSWPLFRFDPRRASRGEAPLVLDSGSQRVSVKEYRDTEERFRVLERTAPESYSELLAAAERATSERWHLYTELSKIRPSVPE